MDEGDCDSNNECKNHLFCGSNNCPFSIYYQELENCIDTCGNPNWKGDKECDDENNNCGCEWDGGDCCGSNVNTDYCSACECLGEQPTSVDCCERKGDISTYFLVIVHIIQFHFSNC